MAKKHRREKIEKVPTRHQLSKWEKQRRISRIITIVSIAFFVIVIGLIGYGYYSEQVMPYQRTVITVNERTFTMDYYIKTLDLYTRGQQSDMLKLYLDTMVNAIQEGEIIREKAGEIGITVSDDDVNKEIERIKFPKSDISFDAIKASLLSTKIIEKECLPKQPTGVEQVEAQAMLLETRNMAEDRRNRLIAGDNFSTMAGMLSIESVTLSKKGYLGWVARDYEAFSMGALKDSVLKEAIFNLDTGVISEPIYDNSIEKNYGYWLLEVLEKEDTKGIHARGILFSDRDEAEQVKKKLAEGADFNDLARQYSVDASKESGGDLGWIAPGVDKGELGRTVAGLTPKVVSEVIRDGSVKTKGGYWIAQVLNKDGNRPLDENIRQSLSNNCLAAWIEGQMTTSKIEISLDQQQKDWALQRLLKTRGK